MTGGEHQNKQEGYLLAFNARWRVRDGEAVIEHGLKGAVPTETDCID